MLMARAALLLLALVLSPIAAAEADTQISGRRVALVIGNGGYRHVDRLANATNDARLIAGTLQKLGFTLVGNGPQLDLDRARLSEQVQQFGRALAGADVGLFYFSGHGLQVRGVNWLVPVDANPSRPQDLDFQMVDADLVLRQMDGAGTKLNLVLLDACRNNPFTMRGLRSMQGGLAEMRAPEGTLISYATQPGNVAMDGTGANSPYTAALAEGMQQPGLDIFRIFNRVGLQVKRSTGGSQQPWVSTSPIDGEFYFAGVASSPPQIARPVLPAEPIPAPQTARPSLPAAPILTPQIAMPVPPAEPIPTPQPAASAMPATPAERLLAMARGQRCSLLDVKATGPQVDVVGLAPAGADWDGFRQMGATRGLRIGTSRVELLPPFACEPIEVLGESVRATRDATGNLMTLSPRKVTAGGTLTVALQGAAGQAIALDLFGTDGMVQHVPVRPVATGNGNVRVSIPQPGGSPPGPRLLTALVSPTPLELGNRPSVEPASSYLAALRPLLQAELAVRTDVATYELRAAVTAVAAPARPAAVSPARSARCATILEKAQLGETLSDAERARLRAECR
ncbi:caspase family protein [Roseomonas harenae]|uniref:caspase family protein n=1 Tax=Muricoccus harenae TaxID=2692566 RepID=UPI001915456A|nr:caspase family protein [Roseomonas harenae]